MTKKQLFENTIRKMVRTELTKSFRLTENRFVRFPETLDELKKIQRQLYQNINNNDPNFNYSKLNRFFENFFKEFIELTKNVDKFGPNI